MIDDEWELVEPEDIINSDDGQDSNSDDDEPLMGYLSKNLKLDVGDKFTKQPLWYGKHLIMLGREHIHTLNLETGFTYSLPNRGENRAEAEGKIASVSIPMNIESMNTKRRDIRPRPIFENDVIEEDQD